MTGAPLSIANMTEPGELSVDGAIVPKTLTLMPTEKVSRRCKNEAG